MLLELYVENYILIDQLQIPFQDGLNVLTGETGAGKSILLGAIGLILGDKFNKDTIQAGKDKATIQGTFIPGEEAQTFMESIGLDRQEEYVVLSRELYESGRSVLRINGRIFPKSVAAALGQHLVDIHGQNEHQVLLRQDSQRKILDQFATASVEPLLQGIKACYHELKEAEQALQALEMDEQELERKTDVVRFQLEEIQDADLQAGEDSDIEGQLKYLKNYESIHHVMQGVQEQIHHDEGVLTQLSAMIRELQSIESLDDDLGKIRQSFEDLYYGLEGVSDQTRPYVDEAGYDPEQLQTLEERYDLIETLKRKYGKTIEDVKAYGDQLQTQLEQLLDYNETVSRLRQVIQVSEDKYDKLADQLTSARRSAASLFRRDLLDQLQDLNMKEATFEVSIETDTVRREHGKDRITFLIASNPGQPLRDMKQVVSGGELSRIMLAIKILLGKGDDAHTLIFDEVDAGISGITAAAVGDRLREISKTHQVICITHLPQIAVAGAHHLLIEKSSTDDSTKTVVRPLQTEERIHEIGRLIGDGSMTQTARAHAEELLRLAGHLQSS